MPNSPFSLLDALTRANDARHNAIRMQKATEAMMQEASNLARLRPYFEAVNEAAIDAGQALENALAAMRTGNLEDAQTAAQDAEKAAQTAEINAAAVFFRRSGPANLNGLEARQLNADYMSLFFDDLDTPPPYLPSDDYEPPPFGPAFDEYTAPYLPHTPDDEDTPPYLPFDSDIDPDNPFEGL